MYGFREISGFHWIPRPLSQPVLYSIVSASWRRQSPQHTSGAPRFRFNGRWPGIPTAEGTGTVEVTSVFLIFILAFR